ncbi:MAG: Zn-dependent alcohol dehydrogenase [Deltaproteobacteria bacterium]|nr:Zn-dependent alcohol dehydrogenase [Deltaproteobacteria bacterium]
MKAALLEAPGTPLVIADDIEIQPPRVGEVRVRVRHCGLCHSDLSLINGTFPAPLPIIVGHEAAGVVEDLGPGVSGLAAGDRVVLTPCPPCGGCYWCVRGEPSACVNANGIQTNTLIDGTTGLSRGDQCVYRGLGLGALAQFVVTPATGAVKVPADTPLDVACVIGCAVQTGVGAVLNTAKVEEGATVLVMGLGGVGLAVVQGARLAGAARIIASDPVAERRAAAARFGATDLIDPNQDDVLTACLDLTGVGADYAFETAGRASLVQIGIAATRTGGTTVCLGAPPMDEAVTIAPAVLFTAGQKKLLGCILGSANSLREIPRLVALWRAGRLDLDALVTTRRPLHQINEAAADLQAGRGIRTVLEIG